MAKKYSKRINLTNLEDGRVISGKGSDQNSYPFLVRLDGYLADGSGYLCGGTLIHENFVLTAAHCVYNNELVFFKYFTQ